MESPPNQPIKRFWKAFANVSVNMPFKKTHINTWHTEEETLSEYWRNCLDQHTVAGGRGNANLLFT